MSAARKLQLRKDLEGLYGQIKSWKRDDLITGRWFSQWLESALGGMANPPTPPEMKEKFTGCESAQDLVDDIVSTAIHEAILATDAYQENLTGTEIKSLKDKKPGGEQKLTGDTIAIIAEMLYAMRLIFTMIFQVGAAHERQVNAGDTPFFEEVYGKGLGAFDFEKAKAAGNALDQIGMKIFDRAIVQTIGSGLGDAQRKGFYCFYTKAVATEASRMSATLPEWKAPPPRGAETGAMMAAPTEEEPPAY